MTRCYFIRSEAVLLIMDGNKTFGSLFQIAHYLESVSPKANNHLNLNFIYAD